MNVENRLANSKKQIIRMEIYRPLIKTCTFEGPSSHQYAVSQKRFQRQPKIILTTDLPGITQLSSESEEADHIYTSLNHHAENMYHPNTCRVESEKAAWTQPWNCVLGVRDPTCISPTRSTNITKHEMARSSVRTPQTPSGNHDQKTAVASNPGQQSSFSLSQKDLQ